MVSGLIAIKYKPGITESKIAQRLIEVYTENKDIFENMKYFEFDKDENVTEIIKGL